MAEPVDPLLPERLRNLRDVVKSEAEVERSWYQAIQEWLDRVRPMVMRSYRESAGAAPPQPSEVSSESGFWVELVAATVMPLIRRRARETYRQIAQTSDFDADEFIRDYFDRAQNRLVNVPNEVYADISRILNRGLDAGQSIPEISDQIQERLTASATDFWPNRATTVARTEVIGASNAGSFAGAQADAVSRGDANPEKVWLSTIGDGRTRLSHRIADGQRQPLMQPFIVGGFPLMFPGDPSGPPGEVINCRCSLLNVVAGENLDWTDRQNL